MQRSQLSALTQARTLTCTSVLDTKLLNHTQVQHTPSLYDTDLNVTYWGYRAAHRKEVHFIQATQPHAPPPNPDLSPKHKPELIHNDNPSASPQSPACRLALPDRTPTLN